MDPIQPVGAMIQPVDPAKGLNAYSTLLGIQSQKLGIQQQEQGLQGQAAVVSQEQQKNREMQQAAQVAQQGALSGEDRLTTAKKISAIGPYAQSMASSLLSQANEVVQNRQAIQNLTVAQKSEIGNTIQSLVQDPDLSQSKFIDEIERLRSQHPNDPDFSRLLTSTTALAINKDDTQPQLRSKLGQMWSALSGQPQAKPYTQGMGPGAVSGAENVMTGARTPASFQPFGLGPTDQPGYKQAAAAAAATGAGYAAGGASADVERANEVGSLARNANWTIDLSKRVDQLATMINQGDLAAKFAGGAKYLGFSSVAQVRTELVKDLGLLKGPISAAAGSDARAASILEGYPTDTTPEGTVHSSMDQIRGRARQDLARNQLLSQYKTRNPQDLQGYQAADNALMTRTSPLMHEFSALKPEERGAFYRRNFKTPQEAQQFKDSVKASQNAAGP